MKYNFLIIGAFFITSFIYGQTGPAGVGTNDGTSNLKYWIDANRGATGTNPLTALLDLSGNSVYSTIHGDPMVSANLFNGYSVFSFDGAGDYISTNLSINAGTSPQLDIYTVYYTDGSTTAGAVWGEDNGGFDRFFLRSDDAGPGCSYAVSNGGGCSGDPGLFPANMSIITGVYFNEDVDNGSNVEINGSNLITFTSNHAPDFTNQLDVGSLGSGNFTFKGEISEVIVFDRNLNAVERIILNNYLSAKYNNPLTSNDIYNKDDNSNGHFDHNVAGIGRINSSIQNDAQGTGIVRILNPTNLDDNEFLIWGNNNGIQQATETIDVPATVEARFDRLWRVSEVNISSIAVDVGLIDIRFDLTGIGAITSTDLRLLIDTDNDGVFADEAPISGATHIGNNIYQFTAVSNITNNSRFTLGTINTSQTLLPIDLLSFNASLWKNSFVKINWSTASENNNNYFLIERSNNLTNWEKVREVKGAENSSIVLNYSTVDKNPYHGLTYYRLKQVDFDGNYSFSEIKSVNNINEILVNIYPNPTNNQIVIETSKIEREYLSIINVLGQNLINKVSIIENTDSKIVLDLSSLKSGIYIVKTKTTASKIYKH